MKVLVTGANGFVGKPLCERLLAEGMPVRAGLRDTKAWEDHPAGLEMVQVGSIGPGTDWSAALKGVEVVVHLAARVHVMEETSDKPLELFRNVNVAGTEKLARAAAAAGIKRFVFLSSIKVLGEETGDGSFSEATSPLPLDPYGQSKFEAEQVLERIGRETGMEVVILRPPLVYGPGVKANFLNLMNLVSRGVPLPLATVGNRRSFVFLGNLIDALKTLLTHPKAAGRVYLVSDGEALSTPDLIRRIAVALDRPARLFPFPIRLMCFGGRVLGKGKTVYRLLGSLVVDSGKIQTELGWRPPYSMAEGLSETAKWYQGRHHEDF